MKFCFVILHYKTAEDTIECVNSINRLNDECSIVIVDNASNNGSTEKLENKFKTLSNVTIIKNRENVGFAAGNNVGYQYARDELKADFIAISNNDIIVETPDFINKWVTLFEEMGFYIAGPDIESLIDHKHQSPMDGVLPDLKNVKKEIWRYRVLYALSRLNLYDLIKGKQEKNRNVAHKDVLEENKENVVLHGAFVVFSPNFVKVEEHAFRPGTFLYMEEAILYKYCSRKDYKMIFTPSIKVFHKEDSSTNSLFSAKKEKREFVFKNMIQSLKVYYTVLKK